MVIGRTHLIVQLLVGVMVTWTISLDRGSSPLPATKLNIMIDTYNNPPEDMEDECNLCGEPCDGNYCSKECRKAYESEN